MIVGVAGILELSCTYIDILYFCIYSPCMHDHKNTHFFENFVEKLKFDHDLCFISSCPILRITYEFGSIFKFSVCFL